MGAPEPSGQAPRPFSLKCLSIRTDLKRLACLFPTYVQVGKQVH
jgi:hypothetical protein